MQKLMQDVAMQASVDNEMLRSMSFSFRNNWSFSFNGNDMADLLDRLRDEHYSHLVD